MWHYLCLTLRTAFFAVHISAMTSASGEPGYSGSRVAEIHCLKILLVFNN